VLDLHSPAILKGQAFLASESVFDFPTAWPKAAKLAAMETITIEKRVMARFIVDDLL
jgi:hypothetical protein